jgi:hypothetical protein
VITDVSDEHVILEFQNIRNKILDMIFNCTITGTYLCEEITQEYEELHGCHETGFATYYRGGRFG